MLDREQRDLLISLSYLYLACGQEIRALPLLWLLERDNGNDPEVLRALAHALTAECMCDQALKVIDRVEALEGAGGSGEVLLLRSRALHAAGQRAEARARVPPARPRPRALDAARRAHRRPLGRRRLRLAHLLLAAQAPR